MTQIKIYNQDGNVTGEMAIPDFLLSSWKPSLAHQVFKAIAANKRKPTAHTKDRSEVRGGGRKPWRQKGTGNARHGSSRSPIWRHGGVTFGPKNTTDFSQKINAKMMKQSLISALSKKASSGELKIISDLQLEEVKTKKLAKVISNIAGRKSIVLVVSDKNRAILRAAANLSNVKGISLKNLNTYEILTNKYVLMNQGTLNELIK